MKQKIAILIPYFGEWPGWIDFFIESCRWNRGIDWIIFNDRDLPENRSRNVRHIRTSFADYKTLVSDALGIRFTAAEPYKLCEIRPALPYVHRDLVAGYDFVGFGDLDVIYGDLRSFYDEELLASYDLFSSHSSRVSGHLCLMRNRVDVVTAFERDRHWRTTFERQEYMNFDERAFFNTLRGRRLKFPGLGRRPIRCFFREAYSTPGATDRMRWYWKEGRLTNEFYPYHPFMYLHFMSWHSNRWYADQPGVAAGTPAPWSLLPELVSIDWRDARKQGFMISARGIGPIEPPHYP
jgi:uncharacterized protein DUF6625